MATFGWFQDDIYFDTSFFTIVFFIVFASLFLSFSCSFWFFISFVLHPCICREDCFICIGGVSFFRDFFGHRSPPPDSDTNFMADSTRNKSREQKLARHFFHVNVQESDLKIHYFQIDRIWAWKIQYGDSVRGTKGPRQSIMSHCSLGLRTRAQGLHFVRRGIGRGLSGRPLWGRRCENICRSDGRIKRKKDEIPVGL